MDNRTPIIGKNDQDIKEFKAQKVLVKKHVFKAETLVNALYSQYFRSRVKSSVQKGSVFISVPSSSRTNDIPRILGMKLSVDFKGYFIDSRNYFGCNHESQAKTMLSLEKRIKDPISYYRHGNIVSELKNIAGKKVYLIDDVLGSGESIVNFAMELKKYGIDVDYLMCLKNVEVRYSSERDIERLYSKLEKFTPEKESLKRAIKNMFWPYPKMRINRAERSLISDNKCKSMAQLIIDGDKKMQNIKKYRSLDRGLMH